MKRTSTASEFMRIHLLKNRIRKANGRIHRPCRRCGRRPIVCSQCGHIWCQDCHPVCPHPHYQATIKPTITEVPIERVRKLTHPKRPPPILIDIPPKFDTFASQVHQWGGIITKLERTKTHKNRWALSVLIPPGASLQKPDFSMGWFEHPLHSYLNKTPTQKGVLIDTVIGEKP